ncbi:hypothetical protein HCTV5_145 [Halovirus HCTV-5]|uniref:hypothetical protein n=1 Tax=Halovirus HCTV-5 TaxID=1273748 RepID=UPI0003348DE8|nr:hypothetical protein M200_gp085 [Halovirus HCTV-5]AGM11749.1 hypothetical protein HCTV5_145 [Halovirus HCTV-5]
MTTMSLRSFVSRVSARLRRSKPCGCVYPVGAGNVGVPEAHRVDDRVTDDGEYIVEYRCDNCEDTFELSKGALLERDLNE